MQSWECKCGNVQCWGSDPPPKCLECAKCGTAPKGTGGEFARAAPHQFKAYPVATDEGPRVLSRCAYCHHTQAQIDRLAQPA